MIEKSRLLPLLAGHWYDALAAILTHDSQTAEVPQLAQARDLAIAAKRVLDLDAEDFAEIASGFDRPWAARLAACCFPLHPKDPNRGALGSLIPLYELMLEELELRAQRDEPLQIVVTAHLIGEYLPQLAWESVLGHGGDPLRLGFIVGERWGSDDRGCPHSQALKAAARRALTACHGDLAAYTSYLDRFHSRQGEALAMCAMNHHTTHAGDRPDCGETCANPCQWAIRNSSSVRRDLDARCRLALMYRNSALVALRHHAPVGHFFGVPSDREITEAWRLTWQKLTLPWKDGTNPLSGDDQLVQVDTEALPGMSRLVSVVAGQSIKPGWLVRAIAHDIEELIQPS